MTLTHPAPSTLLPRVVRIAIVTMFAAAVFALLESGIVYVGRAMQEGVHDRFSWVIRLTLVPWMILGALAAVVVIVAERVPVRRNALLRTIAFHSLVACAFASAHLIAIAWMSVRDSGEAMQPRLAELFVNYFVVDVMIYWALVGTVQAVLYYREAQQRALQASALRATLSEARLSALRAQLQPHFLFNTLNTVSMLVRGGEIDSATKVLAELGALLRTLIYEETAQEIPLETELALVLRYLEIERARFGERLTVASHVYGCEHALVPSFVLQPLAENAIRHGLARTVGAGCVEVLARREEGELVLEVRNSPSCASPTSSAGVGLQITRDRLSQLYQGASSSELVHTDRETVARIRLPFREATTDVSRASPRRDARAESLT